MAHPDITSTSPLLCSLYPTQVRAKASTPLNTIIMFVPQQEVYY